MIFLVRMPLTILCGIFKPSSQSEYHSFIAKILCDSVYVIVYSFLINGGTSSVIYSHRVTVKFSQK